MSDRVDAVAEFKRHLPEMIDAAIESDKTQEDCMAGKIAANVMRQLGFREPLKHPISLRCDRYDIASIRRCGVDDVIGLKTSHAGCRDHLGE